MLTTDGNGGRSWTTVQGGSGTSDYSDLTNKPSINSVTLSGNKSLSDLGIAAASAVTGKADKVTSATNGNFAALDSNGNLTDSGHKHSDYLTSHQDITGKADKVTSATNGHFAGLDSNGNLTDSGKSASDFGTYSKPSGGIPSSDMASAVQTSLGKADSAYQKPSGGIPASDIASGVIPTVPVTDVKVNGTSVLSSGTANIPAATGSTYGVVKADGGITLIETVSGSTPSLTCLPNVRYNCGEVSTISITPPATGTCDVFFTSGTTATVLTVPNTVKFSGSFDATSLEASTIYEIMITDGVYGSVMTWAS